jgi:hypothetical protein
MKTEISNIGWNDIYFFERLLRLSPDYKLFELYMNFSKISKYYHPSVRSDEVEKFEQTVIAFEVLKYLHKGKIENSIENLLFNFNSYEKKRVSQKISYYKNLDLKTYKGKIEYNSLAFLMIKGFFSFIFFSIFLFVAIILIIEYFLDNISPFGIFFWVLIFLGIIIRIIKKD